MAEEFDISAFAAMTPLFEKIDVIDNQLYKTLKEKNIEPKSNADVERTEKFFNKALNEIITLVDESTFGDREKEIMKTRLILDMHGNFSEVYNIDFLILPSLFGSWNEKLIKKAFEDVKNYM